MSKRPGGPDDETEREPIVLTDREAVRTWAEQNDVVPVRRGESGGERRMELVRATDDQADRNTRDWDAFLDAFDERNLALLYTEAGERGEYHGHRLVDRDEVVDEAGVVDRSVMEELLEGATVETRETTPGETEEVKPGETSETTPGEMRETTPGEMEETTPDTPTSERSTGDETTAERTTSEEGGIYEGDEISNRLMGRSVELRDGETIGIVSDVDEAANRLFVDRDPSLADKIKARLHWGDDDAALSLTSDQVLEIRRDAVVLKDLDRTE